jgi:hypothetical protein
MKKLFLATALLFVMQSGFSQVSVSYYKGEWTEVNKHTLFTGIFKIAIKKNGEAVAEMVWTYQAIDSSNRDQLILYFGKKGRSGIEYAEGSFSEATKDLQFESKRTDDPAYILGLDKYHIKLSANKQVLYGKSETQGTNEGLLYAVKMDNKTGEKEFMAAKAKIK